MKTFAEFNKTMSNLAKAINQGFGSPHAYASLFTIDNRACWQLVEMIRFEDPDFYESVYAHLHARELQLHDRELELKEGPDSDALNKLMESLAYMIIEQALYYHWPFGLYYETCFKYEKNREELKKIQKKLI